MRFVCALLLWAVVLQLCSAERDTIRRLDGSTISKTEASALARSRLAEAHVTGAEIAMIDNGRLIWSDAFGLRRHDPDLPMRPDTNTWAASITKGVFGTDVMQLAEHKEFSLDTPIKCKRPRAFYHCFVSGRTHKCSHAERNVDAVYPDPNAAPVSG